MQRDALQAVIDAAVTRVHADGMALGAAVGPSTALSWRGDVAGVPVRRNTVFYGASLTKQCVEFLMAGAVEAGLVAVNDGVRGWLPELPEWTAQVRVRHLLHHTSGLPEVTQPRLGTTEGNAAVIERLRDLDPPPRINPGKGFTYSNTGYVLLAEIVGRVRGRSLSDLSRAVLFDPLGLSATRLGGRPIPLPGTPDPPRTIGDGGLWTSIADLTRWLTALNEGRLDATTSRRMETVGRLNDGSALDYAWGLRVARTPMGRQVTHGGSWGGWLAKTVRLPGEHVAVAVLSTGGTEAAISGFSTELAAFLASHERPPTEVEHFLRD